MPRPSLFFAALLACAIPAAAHADPVPPHVADMLHAAVDGGDAAELAATVNIAKKTNPRSVREIDALVATLAAQAEARRRAALRRKGFFRGWSGQGQVGFSNTTGNSQTTNIALGLDFARKGLNWDHAFHATADYERQDGVETQSRYFASYDGHYKFNPHFYALGLVSWENARFSGFDRRLSEAIGLGYAVISKPGMTLSIEAGPALRQTNYVAGNSENEFAGRASVNYLWKILPDLSFTETVSFYGQSQDNTLTSDTGLTANLIGSLAARLSYHVNYESNPPLALQSTDTISRVTLVYSF